MAQADKVACDPTSASGLTSASKMPPNDGGRHEWQADAADYRPAAGHVRRFFERGIGRSQRRVGNR